jgi:hypothetical protein
MNDLVLIKIRENNLKLIAEKCEIIFRKVDKE